MHVGTVHPAGVFLGSTRRDMDCPHDLARDVRHRVRRAIESAGGRPVCMEHTATSFVAAWEFCRDMLEASSYYVGVFAYRRGWCPPELDGKSVTEAEFDWALEAWTLNGTLRDVAAFVPDESYGDAWQLLLERAGGQSVEDERRQFEFLSRLRESGRAVCQFQSFDMLRDRVYESVYRWVNGGLRARHGGGTTASLDAALPLLAGLGRRPHEAAFIDAINQLNVAPAPRAGCFVVHGPVGFGHDHLIRRCRAALGGSTPHVRHVAVTADQMWLFGVTDLVRVVGEQLRLQSPPADVVALGRTLTEILKRADVVFEVHGVSEFDGGLGEFVERFWYPLRAELDAARPPRRLIVFAATEAGVDALGEEHGEAGNPFRPVVLPELDVYTGDDLEQWLGPWLGVQARAVANDVAAKTGGNPLAVHHWAVTRRPWDR